MTENQILSKLMEMEKKMNELQKRVDILEEENILLKRENQYLQLLMTTQLNEQSISYSKRLWGEEFDVLSEEINEEGTLVHILETILEESNNNAIDMFVVNQLQTALLEMRKQYDVIKYQAPVAIILLVLHILAMYFLAF